MRRGALAALCLLAPAPAAAPCRLRDRTALFELYDNLSGANWTTNTNWHRGNDPCFMVERYYGVGKEDPCQRWYDGPTCTAGRISAIFLSDNNLAGALNWSAVGELTNLTILDLSWNSISGTLPSELGLIRNLEILDLSHNMISGTLPSELGAINAGLELVRTGRPAETNQLKELRLSHNALSGVIPPEIAALTGLFSVDVRSNPLQGTLPPQLTALTSLQSLFFGQSNVSGTLPANLTNVVPAAPPRLPEPTGLRTLAYLDGGAANLSGTLPPSISGMGELLRLSLARNALSGSLPPELFGATVLRDVYLEGNFISGSIPSDVGKLRSVETIDVFDNPLGGDIPPEIEACTNLKYLYVPKETLRPIRQRYCRQRLPDPGKYNWRVVRDDYSQMTQLECEDMHDTAFTFSTLQDSGVYET